MCSNYRTGETHLPVPFLVFLSCCLALQFMNRSEGDENTAQGVPQPGPESCVTCGEETASTQEEELWPGHSHHPHLCLKHRTISFHSFLSLSPICFTQADSLTCLDCNLEQNILLHMTATHSRHPCAYDKQYNKYLQKYFSLCIPWISAAIFFQEV